MIGEVLPEPSSVDAGGCGEFDGDTLNLISDFLMTIFSPGGEIAGFKPLMIEPEGLLFWGMELTGVWIICFVSFWSSVLSRYSKWWDSVPQAAAQWVTFSTSSKLSFRSSFFGRLLTPIYMKLLYPKDFFTGYSTFAALYSTWWLWSWYRFC